MASATQAVKDALADAEEAGLEAAYLAENGNHVQACEWAIIAARAAFRAVPGLRAPSVERGQGER